MREMPPYSSFPGTGSRRRGRSDDELDVIAGFPFTTDAHAVAYFGADPIADFVGYIHTYIQ